MRTTAQNEAQLMALGIETQELLRRIVDEAVNEYDDDAIEHTYVAIAKIKEQLKLMYY